MALISLDLNSLDQLPQNCSKCTCHTGDTRSNLAPAVLWSLIGSRPEKAMSNNQRIEVLEVNCHVRDDRLRWKVALVIVRRSIREKSQLSARVLEKTCEAKNCRLRSQKGFPFHLMLQFSVVTVLHPQGRWPVLESCRRAQNKVVHWNYLALNLNTGKLIEPTKQCIAFYTTLANGLKVLIVPSRGRRKTFTKPQMDLTLSLVEVRCPF